MALRNLLACLIFFYFGYSQAQEVIYKNYSVRSGLPSSTIYHCFQDRKGFIWFGTDQGLCRFDGGNFKTYTTSDGLPDNTVFNMVEDSIGRLWAICYNSKPFFLYNGLIHNSDNDVLLREVDAVSQFFNDVEVDRDGWVWLLGHQSYRVQRDKVTRFTAPDSMPVTRFGYLDTLKVVTTALHVYSLQVGQHSIQFHEIAKLDGRDNNVPSFHRNTCYLFQRGNRGGEAIAKITIDSFSRIDLVPLGINHVVAGHSMPMNPDSVLLLSAGTDGIKAFDLNLHRMPDPYPFLPKGVAYTYTLFDKEGNTWISSLGNGVFFIPAYTILRYQFSGGSGPDSRRVATSVYKSSSSENVYCGFNNSGYAVIKGGHIDEQSITNNGSGEKRIIRQCSIDESHLLIGADFGLYLLNEEDPLNFKLIEGSCVKNLVHEGKDSALVGSVDHAFRLIKIGGRFIDQNIWNNRTTAITKDITGKIWLGSLSGLYVSEHGDSTSVVRFGKSPLINKSRITDLICDGYGNIWVATHQRGVFVITADSIIAINTREGLPDEVSLRFFRESNREMWVATNRHIAKISYSQTPTFKFEVSSPGELSGNEEVSVNDLYIDSSFIWVATSMGLLKMQKMKSQRAVPPPVYITSFHSTDSVFTNYTSIRLKNFQNNLQIDYVGISYNSGGKVAYKYLLEGDTIFTYNTSVNLSSLAPGNYTFQVWAKDMTGTWSTSPAALSFEIFSPFWKTWWFISLIVLAMTLAVWAAVRWRIQRIRKREREKTNINKRIAEIELQAMRAQMNEHFIFNSLNSIQNFINKNDTEAANFYLANFGRLIRRTLDISSMPFISLKDEMDYLDNYLLLEKMRYDRKFDYFITNHITTFSADVITFPSMILQPYVENAIRHGLRYKNDGRGILHISFSQQGDFVVCTIDDNGIGRRESARLKGKRLLEYESKGVKLSEDRVDLYNRAHEHKIKVEVRDKLNAKHEDTGVCVIMYVPLNTHL